MQRNRHLPPVVIVRRVFVVQLCVVAGRPSPLEAPCVHQYFHHLDSGERPPPYRSVEYVRRFLLARGVVGRVDARRTEFLVRGRPTAFAVV